VVCGMAAPTFVIVGLLQPGYFATPDRLGASVTDAAHLHHRRDPNGDSDNRNEDLDGQITLFRSAFTDMQRRQCDGDDQHRDREVDNPAAAMRVRLQYRAWIASQVIQPLAGFCWVLFSPVGSRAHR